MVILTALNDLKEFVTTTELDKRAISTCILIVLRCLLLCFLLGICFFLMIAHSKMLAENNISATCNTAGKSESCSIFQSFWLFRNNYRRPLPSKRPKKWIFYLLLLCAGDIEINPGPVQLIVDVKKWARTIYGIGVEKKQHGHRIVKLNKRASDDGLTIGDIIVVAENLDFKPAQMLEENIFETNFVGIKHMRFTILRDDTEEKGVSPRPKIQPIKHQWKTPERFESPETSAKITVGAAKKLFSEAVDEQETSKLEPEKPKSGIDKLKEWVREKKLKKQKQAESYSKMDATKKEKKLEQQRERYSQMTPTSKTAYKESAKMRYYRLTPLSKEDYKEKMGESAKLSYACLTPQSKDAYKEKAGKRERQHYADMTPTGKQDRKAKAAEEVLQKRKEVTPNTKQAMKEKRKEADSKKRDAMTEKERDLLLKFQAEQKARIRKARAEEFKNKTKDMSYKEKWEFFRKRNEQFKKQIDNGCPYKCVVCFTTRYRHQVIQFHRVKYPMTGAKGGDTVDNVLGWTEELPNSTDGKYYICKNCNEKLKGGVLPNCAIINGLGLDKIPPELAKLGPLEARLISKRFIFYKIIQRGVGAKMPKIRGSITNVPVLWNIDVEKCLPRNFKNSGVLALKLKRRMQYKSTVLYHTVRVPVLFEALKWLKENHPDYADIQIENVDEFIQKCKDQDKELHDELFIYEDKPLKDLIEQEDLNEADSGSDNDDKSDEETDDIIMRDDNFQDTMVMENDGPVDVLDCDQLTDQSTEDQKLSRMTAIDIAPAEGKTPLSIFRDPSFEILAHPQKFPYGRFGYHTTERKILLHLGEYIQNRLFSADTRFTVSADWIFAMAYLLEYNRLWSALEIQMRQSKAVNADGNRLTAGYLKTKENRQLLLKKDMGFRFMKKIRATPAYWNDAMRQVLCMVKNFGKPTWFFTLSCADTQWPDMLRNVYFRAHEKLLTDDELEQLTWTDKCNHLRNDPVFVARQWQHRVKEFFRLILLNPEVAPLGIVTDYFYRIEFQQRGAPHIHGILWVRDAPDLDNNTREEVCKFIDDHITVEIPEEGVSDEQDALRHEVITKQTHRCRSTCYKSEKAKFEKKCRFGYPKSVSEKTMICGMEPEKQDKENDNENMDPCNDNDNIDGQTTDDKEKIYTKITVALRRTIDEIMTNPYNGMMSLGWKGNIDTQYITDYYAVIVYILSYICKSEAEMSTLMKNAANNLPDSCTAREFLKEGANAFLKGREVGLLESVFRSCSSLLLKYQTRKVVYIPVGFESERVRLIKDAETLANMEKDSTEIFAPNLLEKYADRSALVQNLCLAEFAAYYVQETTKKRKRTKGESDEAMEKEFAGDLSDGGEIEDDVKLSTKTENTMEEIAADQEMAKWPARIKAAGKWFRLRTKRTAINYRTFNATKNPERYYYSKVLLFMPWRDESTNLAGCMEDPEAFFNANYELFKDKLLLFEPQNIDEIEIAMEYFRENRQELDNAMDEISPEGMREFRENVEDEDEAFLFAQFGADAEPAPPDVDKDLGTAKKTIEFAKTDILTDESYTELITSLNKSQRDIFNLFDQWCASVVSARRQGFPEPAPLLKFISGPGGTGKSHLLKALRQSAQRHFAVHYGHQGLPGDDKLVARSPEELVSLVAAFTGRAANNVNGQTLHSALSLITDFTSRGGNEGHLSNEKIQFLKNVYHCIEVIFIDEISMVSIELLYQIHERLQVLRSEFVGSSKKLFGGITIITFGDLYQLPPVAQPQIFEDPWREETKAKAITGHLWRKHFILLELTEIMRQKGDQRFAELLNRCRTGNQTPEDIMALESRIVSESNCPPDAPRAYPTNKLCQEYNDKKIAELSKMVSLVSITAEDNFANAVLDGKKKKAGTWKADIARATDFKNNDDGKHTGGLMTELTICKSARVMLTKNIKVSDGLCNGSMGIVRDIIKLRPTDNMPIFILVQFDEEKDFITGTKYRQEFFSNIKIRRAMDNIGINHQNINDSWIPIPPADQQFFGKGTKIMIERRMIPLRIGFAATIHKFQGATVKELVVSFEGRSPKQIAHGQAYVALSRVTTLQGLFLLKFDKDVIHHDPMVDLEMQRMRYGIEYMDIRAVKTTKKQKEKKEKADKQKENKEKADKQKEGVTMDEPTRAALKCLQLSASKPESFFVQDFSTHVDQVNKWISDNSTLLHQLEAYYHEMAEKSEKTEKCKRNKRIKDMSGPMGYEIIYNSQNGNSLYCAFSILLQGNMALERTLRSLTTTFFCQIQQFLPQIKTDMDIGDINLFKKLFIRGKEGNIAAAFCLCCSIGVKLHIIQQLPNGTFELLTLSPNLFNETKSAPLVGYVLMTNDNRFWPLVKTSRTDLLKITEIQFNSTCNINEIVGHDWKTENYTDWNDFENVQCYATTDKKSRNEKHTRFDNKQETSKPKPKPESKRTTIIQTVAIVNHTTWTAEARYRCQLWLDNNGHLFTRYDQMKNAYFNFEQMQILVAQFHVQLDELEEILLSVRRSSVAANCNLTICYRNQLLHPAFKKAFSVMSTPPDGNCWLHMLAIDMFGHCYIGHTMVSDMLRLVAVRYAMKHEQQLKDCFPINEPMYHMMCSTSFYGSLFRNGSWGDEKHLFLMSNLLRRPIYIYARMKDVDEGNWQAPNYCESTYDELVEAYNIGNIQRQPILTGFVRYEPREQWNEAQRPLLGFFSPGHYSSILPNNENIVTFLVPRVKLPI